MLAPSAVVAQGDCISISSLCYNDTMKSKISILGSGATGVHAAVFLLEHYYGEILLYDTDTDYAKGMALDCMQAAAVRGWQGTLTVPDSIENLYGSDVVIVAETNQSELVDGWTDVVRNSQCGIYASGIPGAMTGAVTAGVPAASLLGVQGMVDARILAEAVAQELNISIEDVHAMVYGAVGKDMQSSADMVRVNGIAVNAVADGLYERAIEAARSRAPYDDQPWSPQYTFASAAVELALILMSGRKMLLPITVSADGAERTIPSLIGNYTVEQSYADLVG